MERGEIVNVIDWGVGRIRAEVAGDYLSFSAGVFNEDWSQAYEGRLVAFTRYATRTSEARKVVGR